MSYSILYIFLLFIQALDFRVPMLNKWDEILTLIVLAIGLLNCMYSRGEIRRRTIILCVPIGIIIISGLIGNYLHPAYQMNRQAILRDIVAALKFPLLMTILPGIMKQSGSEDIIKNISKLSKVIVWITLIAAVVGKFVNVGFYTGEIRILDSFQFVFSHPTFYVSTYVLVLVVFLYDSPTRNAGYILLDCFLIFLGQRTKGYIAIIFVVAMLVIGEERLNQFFNNVRTRSVKKGRLFALAVVAGYVAWIIGKGKIESYFSSGLDAARPALYITGLSMAMANFPWGSGFGTFASSLSGMFYSGVYTEYNLSSVWGLMRDEYNYMGDTFWPYIYGQFGALGFISYVFIIFSFIFEQLRNNSKNGKFLAIILLWIYVIFSSTAEAYFTNGTGAQLALFCGMLFYAKK